MEDDIPWINELRDRFGGVVSFALWPEFGCTDNDRVSKFIEANMHRTNPSVVLLALNPTINTGILPPWCAFHVTYDGSKEGRMAKWFSFPPFCGGYMTDLLKYTVETDSAEVMRQWKSSTDLRSQAEASFIDEMRILRQKDPSVFLVGSAVARLWKQTSLCKKYRAKYIWHYSHRGKNSDMVKSWDMGSKQLGLGPYNPTESDG